MKTLRSKSICLISAILLIALSFSLVEAQSMGGISRGKGKDMLNAIKGEIKSGYYDTTFHGLDIDARFKDAEDKLDKAESQGQIFGIIAQAIIELNDSHTTFLPPGRSAKYEYGWRMRMIGDKCFVTAVKPKSDAEQQGLKIGDEILSVEGFKPTRKDMWKINYYYNALSPRNGLNVKVKSPDGEPRVLDIAAKVTQLKSRLEFQDLIRESELNDDKKTIHQFQRIGNTTIWRMPSFVILPDSIDGIMNGRLRNSPNLILDLRGNGGGYVVALERLAGYFVEKDTQIAELKGRKTMKPQMAKTKGADVFLGKLIVLIDANSGSASEIFARFIQLQKRGVVIGDQSAGAVMQSRTASLKSGTESVFYYGVNITNADVIMSDGMSLEHVGVTPNLLKFPTGSDLAAQRDPVLAAALALFGQNVSAEDVGKFFLFDWEQVR